MKAKIILISCILFFCSSQKLSAQFPDDSLKQATLYPGYIVTNQQDTIKGYLYLSNIAANQYRAFYFKSPDDPESKVKYKPKDLKAYKVGSRLYESFEFNATNAMHKRNFFLKVIDGPISLYRWYYEPESRSSKRLMIDEEDLLNSTIDLSFDESDLTGQNIVIKMGSEPINLTAPKYLMKFKKNMAALVEENEEIVGKIQRKEKGYTFGYQEQIIKEYNQGYKNK